MHDSSDGRDDLDPVSYHFCAVIFHAIVTCLVYLLATRLCTVRDALASSAKAPPPAAQEQAHRDATLSDSIDRQVMMPIGSASGCRSRCSVYQVQGWNRLYATP